VLAVALSGCSSVPSSVRNAPGLNLLFGDDAPVLGVDPTEQAGIDYEIETRGLGVGETPEETAENARIEGVLEGAARVYRLQEKPPPSIALLKRRAAADTAIVERALKSEGYYEGEATITVVGSVDATEDADAETDPERIAPLPAATPADDIAGTPTVRISVRKGPRYALARQLATFETPLHPETEKLVQEAITVNVGGPAQGSAVVDAEIDAASVLGRLGYPYVDRGKRRAEANFDFDTIDVRTPYAPGPYTTFGTYTIEGLETVERKYVESFIDWNRGDPVSRAKLAEVQRELSATRLFDAVTITLPEKPPEDWKETGTFEAPIKLVFEESKHRKATAALNFSTVDGPGTILTWENRNLYGQNETLQAVLDISLEEQRARLDYRKPRWTKNERDLIAGFEVFRETREAFDSTGATGSVGIEERLSPYLVGTLGVGFEVAQTEEDDIRAESYLLGLPGSLVYDRTDDLLNPTEGVRITAAAAPWIGIFDEEVSSFLETDVEASSYISIDRDANYILALRGRVAQVFSDNAERVPVNRRVFAGGGGSVRAYGTQLVNDLDSSFDPVGGLGVFEGSIEMRMRFGSFGVVPFVDAGTVTGEIFSEFGDLRWGPGLGVRYFSPVGPIRVDVAVPIDKRDSDDPFQVYLSIGQAF
jgi:translocation and assembly module TamA